MSLAIDPNRIAALLLADGWHVVNVGTVYFDAFEYVWPDDDRFIAQPKAESTGLTWVEDLPAINGGTLAFRVFAPLNSILAVRYVDSGR